MEGLNYFGHLKILQNSRGNEFRQGNLDVERIFYLVAKNG
jgi:hypothetical protein